MQSKLTKNILDTVIYYDILGFPLTSFEIWKFLAVVKGHTDEKDKCSLGDIVEALENKDLIHYRAGADEGGEDIPYDPGYTPSRLLRLQRSNHLQGVHNVAQGGWFDD